MFDQKAYNKAYYQKNRERILNHTNKERIKQCRAEYYLKHKDKFKEYHAKWYQENKHLYNERKDSTDPTYHKQVLYSVWNNFTDEVVIIDGNYIECSKAMGISPNSFHSTVTLTRQGKRKKWTIESRVIEESERSDG